MSPYQYAANDPVRNIDINGDSLWINLKGMALLYVNGKLLDKNNKPYEGKTNGFLKQTLSDLNKIMSKPLGNSIISEIQSAQNSVYIQSGDV